MAINFEGLRWPQLVLSVVWYGPQRFGVHDFFSKLPLMVIKHSYVWPCIPFKLSLMKKKLYQSFISILGNLSFSWRGVSHSSILDQIKASSVSNLIMFQCLISLRENKFIGGPNHGKHGSNWNITVKRCGHYQTLRTLRTRQQVPLNWWIIELSNFFLLQWLKPWVLLRNQYERFHYFGEFIPE